MAGLVMAMTMTSLLVVSEGSAGAQEPPPPFDFSVKGPAGDPLQGLPEGAKTLTSFGERPVISPDGKKIAFVGNSLGDAFEYDIKSGTTKNLTAHTPHNGFYRVHYLADGGYVLTGLRQPPAPSGSSGFLQASADRQVAAEIFFLDKDAAGPIYPLGAKILEGIATSRLSNKIAWVENEPKIPVEKFAADTNITGILRVADVVVHDGRPSLENTKIVSKTDGLGNCMIEAQDFRNNDSEIMAPCYVLNRKAFPLRPDSGAEVQLGEKVVGVSVDTGEMSTYLSTTTFYAELEGVAPKGKWALFECGIRHVSLDICRIDLAHPDRALQRLTFGQDYAPIRFSNPTVSPDGKWFAFQVGPANAEAGTGMGLILAPLPD
jgi:hypothetical protein